MASAGEASSGGTRNGTATPPAVIPVPDRGLGNHAYLVDLGGGRALAVDPPLDLRRLDAYAAGHGLRVAHVAETHLHADFVSGATRLAARDGATVLASTSGRREFPHRGLSDGDTVDLGGLTLRAWATPGHTHEHLGYLLEDAGHVLAVFTGGSLIAGAAARTDLVAPHRTEDLARAQYRSLRRLAALPDETPVYPTHGAGSFCSAAPGGPHTTTIGRERATNPLLAAPDEEAFVRRLLGGLGTFPPYFLRLAEVNRRGPGAHPDPRLGPLAPAQVLDLRRRGAEIVDVRPIQAYAAAHVPGSLAIPLRGAFATWLGWLVADPGTPLVFVREPDQDPEEVAWQALKVGYPNLAGELAGGLPAWTAVGLPVTAIPVLPPEQVDARALLDVRQDSEYAAGHPPGSRHVELGALAGAALPDDSPVVTMCGHGERAATAASLLERAGRARVAILGAGADEWAAATGVPLITS